LLCSSGVPKLADEIPDIQKWTRAPAQQGSEPYVQFVAQLKRRIAPLYDQKIRRFFVSCLRHLEVSDVNDYPELDYYYWQHCAQRKPAGI